MKQGKRLKAAYAAGDAGYERAKDVLTDAIVAAFAPCQEARRSWAERPGEVDELLRLVQDSASKTERGTA